MGQGTVLHKAVMMPCMIVMCKGVLIFLLTLLILLGVCDIKSCHMMEMLFTTVPCELQ